jgi:CheY-like chemotaxis protein
MNNYNFNGKKILVVDDDSGSAKLADIMLTNAGAEVISADDGAKAVNLVSEQNIDLILMDMKMPLMDGYQATRIIRSFNPDLPVIAYTASAMVDDRKKCIDAGCTDYLSKPIRQETFLDTIAKYLK